MEKYLHINTKDHHKIYGTLRKSTENNADHLIIFIHGLACNSNHHLIIDGATYFSEQGYDTYRFDLYSSRPRGRTLRECTIKTHIEDVHEIMEHFQNSYTHISLIAHSLGGPVAIHVGSTHSLHSLLLWDPSLKIEDPRSTQDSLLTYSEELGQYIMNWGVEYIITSDMLDSMMKYAGLTQQQKFSEIPTTLFFAEEGTLKDTWNTANILPSHIEKIIISNANHNFSSKEQKENLFKMTLERLRLNIR